MFIHFLTLVHGFFFALCFGAAAADYDVQILSKKDVSKIASYLPGLTYDPFDIEGYFEKTAKRKETHFAHTIDILKRMPKDRLKAMLSSGLLFNAHPVHHESFTAFLRLLEASSVGDHESADYNPLIITFMQKVVEVLTKVETKHSLLYYTPLITMRFSSEYFSISFIAREYCWQDNPLLRSHSMYVRYKRITESGKVESGFRLVRTNEPDHTAWLKVFFPDGKKGWIDCKI